MSFQKKGNKARLENSIQIQIIFETFNIFISIKMQNQGEKMYQWFREFQCNFNSVKQIPILKKKNKKITKKRKNQHQRKINKNTRYRPLIMGIKEFVRSQIKDEKKAKQYMKKIKRKVNKIARSEKSYITYFLWLTIVFGNQLNEPQRAANSYDVLKRKMETTLNEQVKRHLKKYGEEFALRERRKVQSLIESTKLFFRNEVQECINKCYNNGQGRIHGTTENNKQKCQGQVQKAFKQIERERKI